MPLPIISSKMTIEEFFSYTGEENVELIDGVLYDMASPSRIHQAIVRELSGVINGYIQGKGGDCVLYPAPFAVQLSDSEDTVVEPDISVICDRNKLNDRGCLGAPDWIIEVASPTSISHDYIKKLQLYSKTGVKEYWIVNPSDTSVTVYNFSESNIPHSYGFADIVPSGIYKDFGVDFRQIKEVLAKENLIL